LLEPIRRIADCSASTRCCGPFVHPDSLPHRGFPGFRETFTGKDCSCFLPGVGQGPPPRETPR
jgi:hypothetical protein